MPSSCVVADMPSTGKGAALLTGGTAPACDALRSDELTSVRVRTSEAAKLALCWTEHKQYCA